MEKIFGAVFGLGVAVCLVCGQADAVFPAATAGAQEAVTLVLGLIGVCALWSGLMRMADGAGLSKALARLMQPLFRRLFSKQTSGDPQATGAVATAFSANIMGLGNAATPLAIQAMKKIKNSRDADVFWLLSASALQLIPTTVIAMRAAAGAKNAADILMICILASAVSTLTAILIRPKTS